MLHAVRMQAHRLSGRLIAALVLAVIAFSPALGSPEPTSAAGRTYYVDCAGNDSRAGTSTSQAWRSLERANQATLTAGDELLLRRGCTWTGPLKARWTGTAAQPIKIGAYGSGARPLIQNAQDNVHITGSYQVIEQLATRADPPGYDAGCDNQPAGWRMGFRFFSGASHNVVQDSTASNLYTGIYLGSGTHHNKVLRNVLRDNNMKDADPASDAGAVGIVIAGDDNEIAYNDISGSDSCSRWFGGRDGSAIDVYGGRRNVIHHNVATDNNNFLELGNSRSNDNIAAYNVASSRLRKATWLVVHARGAGYGPVLGTKMYNNTAYLTGAESYAIQCNGRCAPDLLSLHNNIVWSEDRIGYADAAFDEGHNIFWRANGSPRIWFPTASTSRVIDPQFVDPARGDFRLRAGSPALNAGSNHALDRGFTVDLDGVTVPQGSRPDIGAYERPTMQAPPAPEPDPEPEPEPDPEPEPADEQLVADGFQRSVSRGWGSASPGGAYRVSGAAADFGVNGWGGTMRASAGQNRAAHLRSVVVRDTDATFRVATDRLATGNGTFVYLDARHHASAHSMYRLKIRFARNRQIGIQATRVINGSEAELGREHITNLTHAPDTFVRVRVRIDGSSPTTIRARAWLDGQPEPSGWQYTATDSTSALQAAGHLGLRTYVSSSATSGATLATFDHLVVEPR